MKKITYLLFMFILPAFIITGCSSDDNDDDKEITLSNQSEETQTAFADEETTGNFTFTAKSSWTANVSENKKNKSSSVPWLRLMINGVETYNGDAGTFTMTIDIDQNYSGAERSATIIIKTSNNDEITVTVTQNKSTEAGIVPKLISRVIFHDHDDGESHDYDEIYTFTYDNKGRVASYSEFSGHSNETVSSFSFTYETDEIVVQEKDYNNTYTWTYKLNNKGYVTSLTSNNRPSGYDYMNRVVTLSYDNNDYLNKATTVDTQDDGSSDTYYTDFIWENGNLTNVDNEEFYTYNEYPNFYNIDINQFIYDQSEEPALILGLAGKTSKNLIDTRRWTNEDPDDLTTIRYEFDDDGYVTKIYATWVDSDSPQEEALWIEVKYLD